MSRQFPRTATSLALLAAGLLTGWNAPYSVAQQSPDAWSGEHRALLPSGLSVQLDFTASPGVSATAEPGELGERAGGGRAAGLYADGTRPGDPAQTFAVAEDRPQTDGSWRTVGTLQLTFSRPVRNPRLHLSGLAAVATGKNGTTSTAARLTLTGGSPAAPALVNRTDWPGWTVDANTLAPAADGGSDGSGGSAAEGSLELAGTFRTALLRVEQRSTARGGSTTAPPVLRQAYTVTVDEDLGTAPQGYGNASHVVSDLFLGADAANPTRRARPVAPAPAGAGDEPLVELDHGAARRSVFASPLPPKLQPGRGEYQGADPSISFPTDAAIGHYYRVTVPVAVDDQPATLAGWIDFDRNGRFDPAERVQTEVPAGADTATLEWTVPSGAASGDTWARLRIAREASQLVPSGGFADSGQVSDQRIRLTVGAARPEIAEPVDGTALADARPQIRGEGAVAGATVEIRDGDAALCRARVERGGDWSCRPGTALAAGPHTLTPVETTSGGVVLRGEAVRVTVKTAPPAAPSLTLPEFTNDPGLQLTGTGEAGSTVSVADQRAELCSSAVRADGQWSCLPVENLADGRHLLTPVAVDAAGNRTVGRAVALVVDTVPPDRPVLTSPAAGETVRVSRPKLAGRAEPRVNVLVTARAGGVASDERTVLCGATAALDGSWTCTANRDLTDGEQWLVVTATDLAGNGAAAEPVRVRVAAAPLAPSPVASAPVTPGSSASGSAASSPAVAPSAASSPAASAAASASVAPSPLAPSPAVPSPAPSSPTVATPAVPSPVASVPAPASAVAVPSPAGVVPPAPSGSPTVPNPSAAPAAPEVSSAPSGPGPVVTVPEVIAPLPAGLLPILVPPAAVVPPQPAVAVPAVPVPTGPVASASPSASAAAAAPTAAAARPSASGPPRPGAAPTPSAVPTPAAVPARSAVATPNTVATPSAVQPPSPTPTQPPSSPPVPLSTATAAATPSTTPAVLPTPMAERDASVRAGGRPLPAPPSAEPVGSAAEASQAAAERSASSGWRGGLAGGLLVLTGIGLITRRVFARGPGARRR
ncbi:Ig-like domain-containing protein [Kitasatospora sp. NPDC101176]|uniref:Ig-like domain-containing protein n=1 Tax=Kitasatospora sp. NPDC101176 TaxID=3364099 RepID=UPI00380A5BEE